MTRRYYVVYEGDRWVVMLENGPNIESFATKAPAVERAKELGRKNNRPVMVNFKDGRTGQDYYDYA
jgi:thiamine kinase-like enzyme